VKDCGPCTICCRLLECRTFGSPINEWCKHCDQGCTIHPDRPEECRNFNCAWKLDDNAHPNLRPDKCHVVFEALSEDVVLATLDPEYPISDLVLAQVRAFLFHGSSVVFQAFEGKPRIYLSDGATGPEVWAVVQETLERYRHDSAKLYHKPEPLDRGGV